MKMKHRSCTLHKKIARFTSLVLIISSLGVTVAGCGVGQQEKAKRTVSILAKNSWYTTIDYENSSIIKQVGKKSGYDINWRLRQPSSYYDAIRPLLLADSSDLADIIQLPDLDSNMEYINAGAFIPLDDYLNQMPNFSKFLKENPDIKASLTTEDGHIYYVPQTVLTKNYQPCIMYNQKWLNKLGISEPKTLDEFVTMLRQFAANDMNGNGDTKDEIPMSVMGEFIPYMFGSAFGLDTVSGFYADENNVIHCSFYESEQYNKFLSFLKGLYDEGLLEPSYETLTRDDITQRCASDQTGVIFDYSWQMSQLYNSQYPSYNGVNPIFTAGEPLSGEKTGYYVGRNAISGLFGVNTKSASVEDSVRLLDYLMGENSQDLYCWGFKGESYDVDDEGNKYYTDKAHDDTWLQELGINPICVPSQQSAKATNELVPFWHKKQDKYLSHFVKDPFPFIYATSQETEIMNGYENYIAKYVDQQRNQFITGKLSLDTFEDYRHTLEELNIVQIIKVKQQQYNRYLKLI